MSTCDYAELDGSYVLGSLPPAERQEFEKHLSTCNDCARSVRELAGLPGLLARVDPVVLEPPPAIEPVPETLLPSLVHAVQGARRRRLFASAGAAAAAAVIVGVVLVQSAGDDTPAGAAPASPTPSATAPVGESMLPVGHVPVTATVAFTSVTWGTRLDLTCSYEPTSGGYGRPRTVTYGLFVVNRDGSAEQVGTWRALDGRTLRLTAATAAERDDIAAIEVRTVDGRAVLKLKA
jgi:Putative zinc-finger